MCTLSRELRHALQAYRLYLTSLQSSPLAETHPELKAVHMVHRAALERRYGAGRVARMYTRCRAAVGLVVWQVGSLTFRRF